MPKLNKEVWLKVGKILVLVLGIFGVNVSPEMQTEIMEGAVALYAVLTGVQAQLKHKEG